MDIDDEKLQDAVEHTEILRAPKQSLMTFGTTNIYYYLVTEPNPTIIKLYSPRKSLIAWSVIIAVVSLIILILQISNSIHVAWLLIAIIVPICS